VHRTNFFNLRSFNCNNVFALKNLLFKNLANRCPATNESTFSTSAAANSLTDWNGLRKSALCPVVNSFETKQPEPAKKVILKLVVHLKV
jgi:hypothetical protein